VGAGGTIGLVNIGTSLLSEGNVFSYDHTTAHAIEAANFVSSAGSPFVTAFGQTGYVPTVLYVDDGSNDVRITNLTFDEG
jgi:hypothetical protein